MEAERRSRSNPRSLHQVRLVDLSPASTLRTSLLVWNIFLFRYFFTSGVGFPLYPEFFLLYKYYVYFFSWKHIFLFYFFS